MFLSLLLMSGCKEKYLPALNLAATSFLVVEGFINSGAGPTTIMLTRTNKIVDTVDRIYERNAEVRVESEAGSSVKLAETVPGIYSIAQLFLNPVARYRLYIKTKSGAEYQSDFSAVRRTPDIDSLSWNRSNGGVQTYVNTHDALNQTRYYQWKYEQTWEFHSPFASMLKYTYDPRGRISGVTFKDSLSPGPDTTIATCWKTTGLNSINIGSSEKLVQDLIAAHPTAYIPQNSQQLGWLYSLNVRQYALSESAYRFLQLMKKNTEQLGTIFDAQPSDNTGNLHCLTNSKETVIGFVEVSEEKQKRIFIRNAQVPGWRYSPGCRELIKVDNAKDSLTRYGAGLMLTTVAEYGTKWGSPAGIDAVYFGEPTCTDCTLTGTNKKPVFWP
ncbi:MAG: hypothetical protein JWQ78_458 [Sediminibacterium sp.]|nr:hypothetical protein [Sediminibacterium sp.]